LKKLTAYLLVYFCGSLLAFAQILPEKGVPLLKSYPPYAYNNAGKIWGMDSAPNGIVYMAADRGLLEYDGINWKHYTGSDGSIRSVLVVNDSLIYTGSDLDFGVWKKNIHQGFDYMSLYPFQDDLQDVNEEFWRIYQLQDDVFFVSSQSIYIYRNKQLVKIAAPSVFTGSFLVNGNLYFSDKNHGLFVFDGFALNFVLDLPDHSGLQISGVYQLEDDLVIVTRDAGLYLYATGNLRPLNNNLSEKLKTGKVFSFEQLGDNHVAYGTVLKGLYIADLNGRIIHHVNRQKGLPGNTILSLHYSRTGKLWLGMDYGVSSLDLNNNVTTFYDFRGDVGTGYTAMLKNDVFFLGTNQGLYRSKWDDLNNNVEFFGFELIPETEGQVWTLEIIEDQLLMGHDRGLYVINQNTAEQLSEQEGVWTIIPYKDFLLTGNYNGISIFSKSGNNWLFVKKMDLIFGSCNQLIVEKENVLWVNIPNFGIIRVVLDNELNPLERLIFPMDLFEGQDVFIAKNELGVHVFTDHFQYTFNNRKMEFIKESEYNISSEIEDQLTGIYFPVALHPDYEFIPIYNGFAFKYLNPDHETLHENNALVLRKIEAFNSFERGLIHQGAKVPYQLNSFHVEVIVPNQKGVLYQYKLMDSGEWSEWQPDNTIELLSLKHGSHQLLIRAMVENQITENLVISLRISAPWYLKWYAFLVYILFLCLLVYFVFSWQKLSLKKQKKLMLLKEKNSLRQQTEKHKQEIMQLEQKRLQAEFDQLKQQLKNKTIELANKAKDNEEKNRLLLDLKDKCEKAQQNPSLFEMKWREMQRILDSYLKIQDKTFEIQMDELHQEFFKTLKEKFPDLSNNDLRLCAYLKIGLNSKEIAELLNIQPSSFYISRSRLRKKLRLKQEEDLYNFLNAV
jgi:AraC family transcriptional regulator, chitin signaling transcriptional activator